MAWETINTFVAGVAPTADKFNLLVRNTDFLYGITLATNWGCPSVHKNSTSGFGSDNNIFAFRHRLRYLKFQVQVIGETINFLRVFYGGYKVYGNEANNASDTTATVDLYDPITWPNYRGAWVTATNYDALNAGDGDIVSEGGRYYKCYVDHTSGASTEPGVGANWTDKWIIIPVTTFTVNEWYDCYFNIEYVSAPGELAMNYVFEDYTTA